MKPKWMRRHYACPDCGLVIEDHDCPHVESDDGVLPYRAFDCPRCSVHYTPGEFYELNQDKWSRDHVEEEL